MPSPPETVLCHYHYDPLDRLISHALPDIPERQRFYCKSRLATEIQGAMRYSIVQHGDQLLAQQRSEGNAPDTTLLATDLQRSVLHTLKTNQPPQPIVYSPYGHRPAESGLLSLLGFNGERPDPVTGCYLLGNGYRVFNPVLMRFNSPDSLSPFGNGGLNSYAYCAGNPPNKADPTGHTPVKHLIALFSASSDISLPIRTQTIEAATKLAALGPLKPLTTANIAFASAAATHPTGLSLNLKSLAIDKIAKNPLILTSSSLPQTIKEQVIDRIGIIKKAKTMKAPPHSMQSRTLEKLANTGKLSMTPEVTISLMETTETRYLLGNELRGVLQSDAPPSILLSRIRGQLQ